MNSGPGPGRGRNAEGRGRGPGGCRLSHGAEVRWQKDRGRGLSNLAGAVKQGYATEGERAVGCVNEPTSWVKRIGARDLGEVTGLGARKGCHVPRPMQLVGTELSLKVGARDRILLQKPGPWAD